MAAVSPHAARSACRFAASNIRRKPAPTPAIASVAGSPGPDAVLLELRNVTKHFHIGGLLSGQRGVVHAVDDVSFSIAAGESFSLVGESGCGKTTLAKLVLLLERPTAGAVLFDGRDIARLSRTDLRGYRRQVQAVFQDPYASLNPRLRVDHIIAEPIRAHV